MKSRILLGLPLIVWTLAGAAWAQAPNYQILSQQLDAERHGYTVMRLWGSHHDMGYGMGQALAQDILQGISEVKAMAQGNYDFLRAGMAMTAWLPDGIEDEIAGIVEGVKAASPGATLDEIDVKVMNTYSDWAYACRSHSCWGDFVQAPVRTLSTRRLDFGTPFPVTLHHVLAAWDPGDGGVRWVNLAWPGYVAVVTGINAHGTLVSLHDYNSTLTVADGVVPRSVATRLVLTGTDAAGVANPLAWARDQLNAVEVATGTFINFYVPQGWGGVFTCPSGGPCGEPRVPQPEYFNRQVLITTNSQTDGKTVPAGGEFMDTYYQQGGVKDLQSHFELMGHGGLHLLSVAYRGEQDMTLWFEGRSTTGHTARVEVEWSELFPDTPPQDGGVDGGADAGHDAGQDAGSDPGSDPGQVADGGHDAGQDAGSDPGADSGGGGDGGPDGGDGGCGCGGQAGGGLLAFAGLFLLATQVRRRRR